MDKPNERLIRNAKRGLVVVGGFAAVGLVAGSLVAIADPSGGWAWWRAGIATAAIVGAVMSAFVAIFVFAAEIID